MDHSCLSVSLFTCSFSLLRSEPDFEEWFKSRTRVKRSFNFYQKTLSPRLVAGTAGFIALDDRVPCGFLPSPSFSLPTKLLLCFKMKVIQQVILRVCLQNAWYTPAIWYASPFKIFFFFLASLIRNYSQGLWLPLIKLPLPSQPFLANDERWLLPYL